MYETADEISWLQDLLDDSYATAGEHLLSIHTPNWRMTASDVCETLTNVCVLNLATVASNKRPLVAPVDGLFLHGRFWFGSSHDSQRFRHIRASPFVSAAHTRGEALSILVHGKAVEVDVSDGRHEELHNYCQEIYDGFDSWGKWGEQPYACIEPDRMYAIRIDLQSPPNE